MIYNNNNNNKLLFRAYYIPGTALSVVYVLTRLVLITFEVGTIIILISQMRRPRHRELKQLA